MTKIGLIRHGITDWNIELRAQGQSDIPLNEQGRSQAGLLARRLQHESWDLVYASDLSRARETAEIIAHVMGLEVHTDPRLREINCGQIEGMTIEERVSRWGTAWRQLDLGMEPIDVVSARGLAALNEIADRHPGRQVLVVSHGALVGITLKRLIPHVQTEDHLLNTSVTVVVRGEQGWDCELYNCIRHLAED